MPITHEGSITKVTFEYDGQEPVIWDGVQRTPAMGVQVDSDARIHVWGRNDTDTDQHMGIWMLIIGPHSETVMEYTDWVSWPPWPWNVVHPGETHEFISRPDFTIYEGGRWVVAVSLFMGSEDDPITVAGNSFILTEVEKLTGEIANKQLEHSGTLDEIPVSQVDFDEEGRIRVRVRNTSNIRTGMGIRWMIRDGSGTLRPDLEQEERWEDVSAGGIYEFIGSNFNLDVNGIWTIAIYLYMYEDAPVLVDEYNDELCTVSLGGSWDAEMFQFQIELRDGGLFNMPIDMLPNTEARVKITAINRTGESQRMSISWNIHDPDGNLFDPYVSDFSLSVGAAETHVFTGPWRTYSKPGVYTIQAGLFLNPPDPIMVDSWAGDVCEVTEEPTPPPPPNGEGTDWIPITLIGGGVALAGAALLIPPKKAT